jgi:hypothetical protein
MSASGSRIKTLLDIVSHCSVLTLLLLPLLAAGRTGC